jgi:hypothetical protein
MTHNHRLQARWTAVTGGTVAAATALSCMRGLGCFAVLARGMSGVDGASEPGRANLQRNDT